jgi:hypothetical protein
MRDATICSGWRVHGLGLIGCVFGLAIASGAGAATPCPSFEMGRSYGAGDYPGPVTLSDLDGDTVPDFVAGNFWSRDLTLGFGNGDGSFRDIASIWVGPGPRSPVAADLDGDSIPDLAVALDSGDGVAVLLGNGGGTYQPRVIYDLGRRHNPFSIAVADLDSDGILDIVTANRMRSTATILRGRGNGTFVQWGVVSTGHRPRWIAVAHLNGDGFPDLVTSNSVDMTVMRGWPRGRFQRPASDYPGGLPQSLAVADLDGDDILDLVFTIAHFTPLEESVSVMLGDGYGSFRGPFTFEGGDSAESAAVADYDDDGILDIAVNDSDRHGVNVLMGNGNGTFRAGVFFPTDDRHRPSAVSAADLDGDSFPDLMTSSRLDRNVTVLLNQCDRTLHPEIDIKPGGDPNSINPALEGDLPVAILGSESFDVLDIDAATLAFGPGGAAFDHSHGPHVEDSNGDGLDDLVAHFRIEEAGIAFGDVKACVSGEKRDGTPFEGCGKIRTVPDMDGDALPDFQEWAAGTDALHPDSDGDGFDDGEEVLLMQTDPLDALDPLPASEPKRASGARRRR